MSDAAMDKLIAELASDPDLADEQPDGKSTHWVAPHQDMHPVQGDDSAGKAELAGDDFHANTPCAGFTPQGFQDFLTELSNGGTSQVEGDDSVGEAERTAHPVQNDGNNADAAYLPYTDWDEWAKEDVQPQNTNDVALERTARSLANGNVADTSDLPESDWKEWANEHAHVLHWIPQPLLIEPAEEIRRANLEAFQGLGYQADASWPASEFGVGGSAGLNEDDEKTQDPVTPPPTTYHPLPAVLPMRKGQDGGKRAWSPASPNEKMPMTNRAVWKPLVVAEMPKKRRRKANPIRKELGFRFVQEDPTDHRS